MTTLTVTRPVFWLVGIALLVLATLAVSPTFAQDPQNHFYRAIRANDLPELQRLIELHGANAADQRGQTPLMFAAAFGSLQSFEVLLEAGADVKATSASGVTALHWAAANSKKVRLLLDRGAEINAKTQIGRSPLVIAASDHAGFESVKLLVERGARIDETDVASVTPLQAAAHSDSLESVHFLLEHGVNVNSANGNGMTALMRASNNGNVDMVRLLLSHKADPRAVSRSSEGRVKNGPIAMGDMTPLHWAAVKGQSEVVKLLLDAGAGVDLQDVRGMTPLMSAVATDHADPAIVRILLEKGADPSIQSKRAESTFDWATKFNNPAVLSLLKLQARAPIMPATRMAAAPSITPRQAAELAIPLLQSSVEHVFKDSGCIPCHAQPVTLMAVAAAQSRGWKIDEAAAKRSVDAIRSHTATSTQVQLQNREAGGGWPDTLLYSILGLDSQGTPADEMTDGVVHFVAARQRADGSVRGIGAIRAPIQDGNFSRTAMSIRAFAAYGLPSQKPEMDERIARAANWLARQTPVTTEDRVMQLLGLKWAGRPERALTANMRDLIATQRPDGGWAQTPYLESDAYATGQVLYTLHQIGTPRGDAAFRKGVDFLLRTQKADGSWYVRNRAMKIQPYFESGFPYGEDQWISASATAWAVMGLSYSEPERPLRPSAGVEQGERISRPAISEQLSPLEPIAPVARDGHLGEGFLRKPPGVGPFPVVVMIHGGLLTRPTEELKKYALDAPLPSRFLAAGYVVAVITFRSRDDDPQSRVSAEDSLAAVSHVRRLSYVDSKSVVIYGCSGGGDLALEVATMTDVAALAAEEPATVYFTGITNKDSPKSGPRFTPVDSAPVSADPKRYYTAKHQTITRDKIGRIRSPILILEGDQSHPLHRFNGEVLIPELQSLGRSFEVITYPGEPHCFAFGLRAALPASTMASSLKAFQDTDTFFRRHLTTQPKPIDPTFITHVPLSGQ